MSESSSNQKENHIDFLALALASEPVETAALLHESAHLRVYQRAPGIFEFVPSKCGQDKDPASQAKIILSCGIHGNETAPIEICNTLAQQLVRGKIFCQRPLLMIFGNIDAIKADQRFISENLNRLFKKNDANTLGNTEQQRAQIIMSAVDAFAKSSEPLIHYDLHTAIRDSHFPLFAVEPVDEKPSSNIFHYQLFEKLGVKAVLRNHLPTNTFSRYTFANFSAQAFTLELGKVKPFGENPQSTQKKALDMLSFLIGDGTLEGKKSVVLTLTIFKIVHQIIKHTKGFKLHLESSLPNFSRLPKNRCVAEDENYRYSPKTNSEYIVFPNPNVAIGQRAGLIISPKD